MTTLHHRRRFYAALMTGRQSWPDSAATAFAHVVRGGLSLRFHVLVLAALVCVARNTARRLLCVADTLAAGHRSSYPRVPATDRFVLLVPRSVWVVRFHQLQGAE